MGKAPEGSLQDSFPMILLFCMIGAYSMNNNPADMVVMLFSE